MKSKQIGTVFNLAPQNRKPQPYLRSKCGTDERMRVAVPDSAMARQNTRTIVMHKLYSAIRNFRDKALVPAHGKTYSPASSLTVPHYRVGHSEGRVGFARFVTEAGNRGAALGVAVSAIQRASFISTKSLAHLFHTPARNGHPSPCSLSGLT